MWPKHQFGQVSNAMTSFVKFLFTITDLLAKSNFLVFFLCQVLSWEKIWGNEGKSNVQNPSHKDFWHYNFSWNSTNLKKVQGSLRSQLWPGQNKNLRSNIKCQHSHLIQHKTILSVILTYSSDSVFEFLSCKICLFRKLLKTFQINSKLAFCVTSSFFESAHTKWYVNFTLSQSIL